MSNKKDGVQEILEKASKGNVLRKGQVDLAIKEYQKLRDDFAKLQEKSRRVEGAVESPRSPAKGPARGPGPQLGQGRGQGQPREAPQDRRTPIREDPEVARLQNAQQQLREDIALRDSKIKELTNRMSMMAGEKLKGNPNIADLSDPYRPTKLAEDFDQLYDNQWTDAYDALDRVYRDQDKVLYYLCRIVRHAYDFCIHVAASQLKDLVDQMRAPISTPTIVLQNKRVVQPAPSTKQPTEDSMVVALGFAKQYRKAAALSSVPGVQDLFSQVKLPELIDQTCMSSEPLRKYVNKCIELLWLMCVQDPPMVLSWQQKDDIINTDHFKFYEKSGKKVREPVWPAVFLHQGGPIVSKGFMLPH